PVAAFEERPVDAGRRAPRHARPARASRGQTLDVRSQPIALALAAEQAQRTVDHVLADYDHGVAREELHAFAVGGEEGPFDSLEALGPVDGDALARDQL